MSVLVELLKVLNVITLSRYNRGRLALRCPADNGMLTGRSRRLVCVLCLIGRFMTVAAGAKSNNKTVSNESGASF